MSSSSSQIQSISIRSTRQIEKYTIYDITVSTPVRQWTVPHRYSEFLNLHQSLQTEFPSPPNPPVPATVPPKIYFNKFSSSVIENRRNALEEYLRVLLECSDDRWRCSKTWKEYLQIPEERRNSFSSSSFNGSSSLPSSSSFSNSNSDSSQLVSSIQPQQSLTQSLRQLYKKNQSNSLDSSFNGSSNVSNLSGSSRWYDTYRTLNAHLVSAKQLVNTRAVYLSQGQSTLAISVAVQAKKELEMIGKGIEELERTHTATSVDSKSRSRSNSASKPKEGESGVTEKLSDAEISKRLDSISTLKSELSQIQTELLKLPSSFNSPSPFTSSVPSSNSTTLVSTSPASSRRIFGSASSSDSQTSSGFPSSTIPNSTLPSELNTFSSEQLLSYQTSIFSQQDAQLEALSQVLKKQKHIGEAIHSELELQNEMLDELGEDVDSVDRNLKRAGRKLGRLQ